MICRICNNVRQDIKGGLYCNKTDKYVGLNQECPINEYEMDKFVDLVLDEMKLKSERREKWLKETC
ncbi:MAG: hypothetical protein ACRCZ1_00775 [Cetobacterium sp.]